MATKKSPAAGGAATGLEDLSTPPRSFEAAAQPATAGETSAAATAYAPSGPRGRWVLVVTDCPYCGRGPHVHLGADPSGVRRAGCGRGQYRLVVDEPTAEASAEVLAFEPARLQRMERRAAELAADHLDAAGLCCCWVFGWQHGQRDSSTAGDDAS